MELNSSSKLLLDTMIKNVQNVKNNDINDMNDIMSVTRDIVNNTNKEVAQDPKYDKDNVDMLQVLMTMMNGFQK